VEFFNRIHSKYTGIKGFITVYNDAIRYGYMITQKAQEKARILVFWEKHGLEATLDAFPVKRSTLYAWKQTWIAGGKKLEALNPKSRQPKTKCKRLWSAPIITEIQRLRSREVHPNLGEKKLLKELAAFCEARNLRCPKPATIGRLIADLGGLRVAPVKVSHFGKIKKVNRRAVLRKPKQFKAAYPGHCVAFDTIEVFIRGMRRYVITATDLYGRMSFAWGTTSHASRAAQEFFERCQRVLPMPMEYVLTDNGSEFKKDFDIALRNAHLTHYHTYPKTPKMNAHAERFNRTIQEEFVDWNYELLATDCDAFNRKLMDWLIWYNTERVHCAFNNQLSPAQYLLSYYQQSSRQTASESRVWCGYTIP